MKKHMVYQPFTIQTKKTELFYLKKNSTHKNFSVSQYARVYKTTFL